MVASGVRNSCETLATKSRFVRSSRSTGVTSRRVAMAPCQDLLENGAAFLPYARDIGHEVAFRPLQPLHRCYVAQGGDGAVPGPAGKRRRVDVKSESPGRERFQPLAG